VFTSLYRLANWYADQLRQLIMLEYLFLGVAKALGLFMCSLICNSLGDWVLLWMAMMLSFTTPLWIQKRKESESNEEGTLA